MPELPEVEHARRSLERWLVGRTIVRAIVPSSHVLKDASPAKISRFLRGKTATAVERRGKHMLLMLSGGGAVHLHLGMTGRFIRRDAQMKKSAMPHVRLSLVLDDASTVIFRDPRMFGRIEIGSAEDLESSVFGKLGPDPVHDRVDGATIHGRLARTKRPIKIALMDQSVVAGLGNIYVAEALWRARLHPDLPASELGRTDASRLAKAIAQTLEKSLGEMDDEEDVAYLQDGEIDNPFSVYGREGELCARCRATPISKSEHAGRSTYFCATCQSLPDRLPRNTRSRGKSR